MRNAPPHIKCHAVRRYVPWLRFVRQQECAPVSGWRLCRTIPTRWRGCGQARKLLTRWPSGGRSALDNWLVGAVPGGGKCHRANAGTDFDPVFFMIEARVLDSALADTKVRGDVFARMAGEHQVHDLTLARSESRDMLRRTLSPSG